MALAKIRRPDWEKIGKLPLLSLGLVCVLLASFPVFHFGHLAQRASVQADFKEAVDFAIRNPTVQIPPRLLPAIRAVLPNFDSNEIFAFLKKGRDESALQKEFEGVVTRTFDNLDSHPFRALGVVPAAPRIAGFAAHLFVHVGWVQLLGAVLLLMLAGPLLEPLWGRGNHSQGPERMTVEVVEGSCDHALELLLQRILVAALLEEREDLVAVEVGQNRANRRQ